MLKPADFVHEMEANGLQFFLLPAAEVWEEAAQSFWTVSLSATLSPAGHAGADRRWVLMSDESSAPSPPNVTTLSGGIRSFGMTHVVAKLETPKGASDAVELHR